ncbi:MAG: amino acid permease [Gemmatimonadaceae bacterium]|jgi:APA family basic amino acid/polyamine antiporter|nr:amino acid permease [Gemmatimonadaceae bacterium]
MPSPSSSSAKQSPSFVPTELPRSLGLWSAIAVVIGTTIGSGIFRSPAGIAAKLPGPLPMLSVWAIGGVFALCGALTLAELAGALPRTGGYFVFIREGWGRLPAFLYGWTELILIRAAALGGISLTFAEYALRGLGYDPVKAPYDTYAHWVAAGALGLMATVNIVGLKWGALVQNVTTLAKYGGLMFIVVLALALGLPSTGGHFTPAAPPGSFSVSAFGLALVSVLWAYDGWGDLTKVGGEVSDPRRTLPRAIILGTLAIILIYLLANIAYLSVLTVEEIRGARLVAADVAERLIGPIGVTLVSLTVLLSTFGSVNGSLLTGPRIFFAMADEGLFFRQVAKVHPKFKTPYVAISLAATIGIAFVLLRSFEQLADIFVTASLVFYILSVGAIFKLRQRPDWNPSMRVPLYPLPPLLFCGATLFLLVNALIDPGQRWGTVGVLGIVALGIPVYYVTVGRQKPSA